MEDILINIIYELLENKNLYNYNNDEKLKNVEIEKYTNILGNEVIDFIIGNRRYTLTCFETYKESEEE